MTEVIREENGQFPKGVSGNPAGRPAGRKAQIDQLKQDLEIAVRGKLKAERVSRILEKMCELAEKGDVKAARLILNIAVSAAGVASEEDRGSGGITIRIENATLSAQKQTQTIDAKVVEVKDNAD